MASAADRRSATLRSIATSTPYTRARPRHFQAVLRFVRKPPTCDTTCNNDYHSHQEENRRYRIPVPHQATSEQDGEAGLGHRRTRFGSGRAVAVVHQPDAANRGDEPNQGGGAHQHTTQAIAPGALQIGHTASQYTIFSMRVGGARYSSSGTENPLESDVAWLISNTMIFSTTSCTNSSISAWSTPGVS